MLLLCSPSSSSVREDRVRAATWTSPCTRGMFVLHSLATDRTRGWGQRPPGCAPLLKEWPCAGKGALVCACRCRRLQPRPRQGRRREPRGVPPRRGACSALRPACTRLELVPCQVEHPQHGQAGEEVARELAAHVPAWQGRGAAGARGRQWAARLAGYPQTVTRRGMHSRLGGLNSYAAWYRARAALHHSPRAFSCVRWPSKQTPPTEHRSVSSSTVLLLAGSICTAGGGEAARSVHASSSCPHRAPPSASLPRPCRQSARRAATARWQTLLRAHPVVLGISRLPIAGQLPLPAGCVGAAAPAQRLMESAVEGSCRAMHLRAPQRLPPSQKHTACTERHSPPSSSTAASRPPPHPHPAHTRSGRRLPGTHRSKSSRATSLSSVFSPVVALNVNRTSKRYCRCRDR